MKRFFQFIAAAVMILHYFHLQVAYGQASSYLRNNEAWFSSLAASNIAQNILSHQSPLGGWPKNVNTTVSMYSGKPGDLKPTFDNGATTDELRFLARIYKATHLPAYKAAFTNGLGYILKAQYPTGGWPQFYPPGKQYHRHITFNDGAMVRLLEFLREIYSDKTDSMVDDAQKAACRQAFERGISCILKCQIKSHGRLTVWCAQHDEITYAPRPARTFELVSFSGAESVGIVRLLMSLDHPSPEVKQAVHAAVAWYESAKLEGIKVTTIEDKKAPKGKNKIVVKDLQSPPLWARFYDIESNRPIFVDRDGIAKYDLADIGYERRNGYAWYGNWPQKLITQEYAAWKNKWN